MFYVALAAALSLHCRRPTQLSPERRESSGLPRQRLQRLDAEPVFRGNLELSTPSAKGREETHQTIPGQIFPNFTHASADSCRSVSSPHSAKDMSLNRCIKCMNLCARSKTAAEQARGRTDFFPVRRRIGNDGSPLPAENPENERTFWVSIYPKLLSCSATNRIRCKATSRVHVGPASRYDEVAADR
jgi:hypothetical protein